MSNKCSWQRLFLQHTITHGYQWLTTQETEGLPVVPLEPVDRDRQPGASASGPDPVVRQRRRRRRCVPEALCDVQRARCGASTVARHHACIAWGEAELPLESGLECHCGVKTARERDVGDRRAG
jgi:hypothetical protein